MKIAAPTERAASAVALWRPATTVSASPKAITAHCPTSTVSAWRTMRARSLMARLRWFL